MDDFEVYLEARGRSGTTIRRYLQVARTFVEFTGKSSRFTIEDVMRFLARQKTGSHKRFLYYVLKTLFKSMNIEWILDTGDVPSRSEPKRPYFNLEETEKILNTVDKRGTLRDRTLIHLAGITGARRQEFRDMDREDYKDGRVYIKTAKKGEPRWRALDPVTRDILEQYLDSRHDGHPAMFWGAKREQGWRLSVQQLNRILKRYLERASVHKPRAGFHSFRRGLVTILHKRGLSEKEIQEYGGWRSPFMVHEYIQLEPGEVEAKVKAVHPFFAKDKEEEEKG